MDLRNIRRVAGAGLVAALALSGCMPILQEQIAATATAASEAGVVLPTPTAIDGAVATVSTRSLRVREKPTTNSRQLGSLLNGKQYKVTGRSSDGQWFELEIPEFASGSGWVSTDLVSVSGAIIDLPIFDVSALPTLAPTPLPPAVVLPTSTPGIVAATVTPTETASVEATPVVTAPVELAPATPEPALAPVEATATLEAIEAAATETVTVAPSEPLTGTPTFAPVVPPAAGFAAISADVRLRVRGEPSTGAPIVGYGYRGEVFPVLESSADGTWTKIGGSAESRENPNGGWVATEFLLFGQ